MGMLNTCALPPGVKPVPVKKIVVPAGPLVGLNAMDGIVTVYDVVATAPRSREGEEEEDPMTSALTVYVPGGRNPLSQIHPVSV